MSGEGRIGANRSTDMQNAEANAGFEAAKNDVQRKTLDQREQMNELMRIRHSCAHMLATAVLRIWPDALLDIGPPTDEGFYYDFDLPSHRFSPEDFPRIEEEMKKVVKENQVFEKSIKTRDEARAYFEGKGQKFKVERLGDIPEGEAISFYQNGDFVDLCAGPPPRPPPCAGRAGRRAAATRGRSRPWCRHRRPPRRRTPREGP